MAEVQIYDGKAGKVKKGSFDEKVFGDKILGKTLREAVLMYEANARQGTADTKERNEVAGTTKKMYKQKHTGRARHGAMTVPNWRGGGVVFGPHPRDYGWSMPRKALHGALRSALYGKVKDGELALLSGLEFEKPSTKQARGVLSSLGVDGSCCVVLDQPSETIWKSFRNFPRTSVKLARDLNAFDVCFHRRLLVTEGAIDQLKEKVGVKAGEEAPKAAVAKKPAAKKAAPKKPSASKSARSKS